MNISEEHLEEFIHIVRLGLLYESKIYKNRFTSEETRENLNAWCDLEIERLGIRDA